MRARYYSPDMRRFVNADIIHGKISDSTSLNRYSYVNGNLVSFVDPFGLSSERTEIDYEAEVDRFMETLDDFLTASAGITLFSLITKAVPLLSRITTAMSYFAALAAIVYSHLPSEMQVFLIETLSGITREEHYVRLSLDDFMNYPQKFDAKYFPTVFDVITRTTSGNNFKYIFMDSKKNYPIMSYSEFSRPLTWEYNVDSACHQFTSANQSNIKYVSSDGRFEVIYDEYGNLVQDVRDVGTYNYASPINDPWNHFLLDVLPWIFWGNSPDDTTTISERLNAFFIDGSQEKVENGINEFENFIGNMFS